MFEVFSPSLLVFCLSFVIYRETFSNILPFHCHCANFLLFFPGSCPCGAVVMSFVFAQMNSTDPLREMQNTT